jgi:hypothetical protein
MHTVFSVFDLISHKGAFATRSLTRLAVRLPLSPQGGGRIRNAAEAATTPLSLLLAGTGPQRRRFAAVTPPDAPSGTSNYGF